MIVKCPQCATGYSIPENLITDKPKKMRCSRCKNVFTLMRRQEKAPTGYEEFTGSQHLPQEFAFLKSAPPEESPRPEARQVDEPVSDQGAAGEAQTPIGDESLPAPQASAPAATSSPAPPVSNAYYAGRQGFAPSREAWEEEVPLELSGYSIPVEHQSRGAQVFGKLVFVLLILAVGLFVFVLARNGWSLSTADLGSQIGFAFSGEKIERISDDARNVDLVVSSRNLVTAKGGAKYLIVSGEAFNRGFTGLSRIMLRGRLVDGAGGIKAEVRAPCGKTVDEETIKLTPKGAMPGHYRSKEGEIYNCVISVDGSTTFQLVFDDVPAEYGSSVTVEVTAVSAQLAE